MKTVDEQKISVLTKSLVSIKWNINTVKLHVCLSVTVFQQSNKTNVYANMNDNGYPLSPPC